jgi:hypothetical protein
MVQTAKNLKVKKDRQSRQTDYHVLNNVEYAWLVCFCELSTVSLSKERLFEGLGQPHARGPSL